MVYFGVNIFTFRHQTKYFLTKLFCKRIVYFCHDNFDLFRDNVLPSAVQFNLTVFECLYVYVASGAVLTRVCT